MLAKHAAETEEALKHPCSQRVGNSKEEYGFVHVDTKTLRSFSASYNPIELGFEWDTVFESNGRVVFMGHVNALYPARTEGQNFRWRAEQVTVVTVRDGVVIRHDDYANYANPEQGLIPAAE